MYHENGITKSFLLSSKLKMLKGDPSISYCHKNDKLSRIVAIHVDIIPAFSKIFVTGKISKNAFRYLGLDMKQNECKLIYQKLGNDNDLRIMIYSDAPQGNLPNGGSQGGDYIIFLCGYQNMCVPLNWQSKHIGRVVQCSLAAEVLTSSDVLDDAAYLMKLFSKVVFNNNYKIPIEVVIDKINRFMNHYFHRKT